MPTHCPKRVLTTGQVATICKVAPRTVSKWFDTGQLPGYRIPGSRDRRIPLTELIRFMRAHGMTLDDVDARPRGIVLLEDDPDQVHELANDLDEYPQYEPYVAPSIFGAGVLVERHRPYAMVVSATLPDLIPSQFCEDIRNDPQLQTIRLLAVGANLSEGRQQRLLQDGFDAYLPRPYTARAMIERIELLLG